MARLVNLGQVFERMNKYSKRQVSIRPERLDAKTVVLKIDFTKRNKKRGQLQLFLSDADLKNIRYVEEQDK